MKKTTLALMFSVSPFALAASMTSTSGSNSNVGSNSNTNAIYDNRDTRTNSTSTPASMGFDNRKLKPDVTRMNMDSRENWQASGNNDSFNSHRAVSNSEGTQAGVQSPTSLSRSSTYSEDTVYETETSPRLSGSSTTESASSPTGKTKTHSTKNSPTPGAVIGTTAVGTANTVSSSGSTNQQAETPERRNETQSTTDSSRSGSSSETASAGRATPGSEAGVGTSAGSTTASSSDTETAAGASANRAGNEGLTAQDTAQTDSATEMVRRIRSEITSDKSLSMNAHNIKIISENNQIFLKGPVKNSSEKSKVEDIAKRMAGNTAVINQTYVQKR